MRKGTRFRMLLPVVETLLAGFSGGIGLWQRSQILDRLFFGDQTAQWRESTARFHVWPWPYKFAAISNMPAFLAGDLVSGPIKSPWPELHEAFQLGLSLVFVAILWYWIGHRLDRRWGGVKADRVLDGTMTSWVLLSVFTAVCLTGAFLPLGNIGYVPYGAVVWIAMVVTIHRTTQRPATHILPLA